MVNSPDLFGEVAVSLREIELWLYKVPRLPHYSTKRAGYVRGWNVIAKIQRAKLDGSWNDAVHDELCEFCGQVLCISGIDDIPADPSKELNLLKRRIAVLEMLLTPGCDYKPSQRSSNASTLRRSSADSRP